MHQPFPFRPFHGALIALLATPLAAWQIPTRTIETGALPAPVSTAPEAQAHYLYDYATGEHTLLSRSPSSSSRRIQQALSLPVAPTASCFDNPPFFDFYLRTTHPATHQELVDWGIKDCGGGGLVSSFTFTYRTTLPSVDLSIAFYLGTRGFGELGTQIARFQFQGLPAGEPDVFNPGGFVRTFNTITVDLSSNPMCLPDGPIGWSFTNDDLTSGMALATAPGAPGTPGTLDALDVYDDPPATNGAYTGTFNFGAFTFLGSLAMTLEEDQDPSRAGIRLLLGNEVNPIALIPRGAPIQSNAWYAEPNFGLVPGADTSTLVLSQAPLSPFATIAGEILIDLVSPPVLVDTTTGFHVFLIPPSLPIGETFYGQAILSGPGVLQLTNGLELRTGL